MRKTLVCTTISIVCGLSAAVLTGMEPRVPETPIALEPGVLFLRHLSAGEEHRYQLPLAEGEFARIVVSFEGVVAEIDVQHRHVCVLMADAVIGQFQRMLEQRPRLVESRRPFQPLGRRA